MATENLIINYFRADFTYNEIAGILSSRHGTNTNISVVVIHKVRSLIFRNFRLLLSCKCTQRFQPTSRPPKYERPDKRIYGRDIFCELLPKDHKLRYKIKNTVNAIEKCPIKTARRALGSRVRFLTVRERWEWIILAV